MRVKLLRRERRAPPLRRPRAPRHTGRRHMARNVEIKARIESIDGLTARVVALADRGPVEIRQDDTCFTCAQGRLKLRAFSSDEGQLIFYRRPNQRWPKESFVARHVAPGAVARGGR